MTYICPAWKSAADTHLIKLQRLQNKVLRTTGNIPGHTPVREKQMASQLPYVYDCMTKVQFSETATIPVLKAVAR
jgi:hypothetical protein